MTRSGKRRLKAGLVVQRVYLTPQEKALVSQAAKLLKISASSFAAEQIIQAAKLVVRQRHKNHHGKE